MMLVIWKKKNKKTSLTWRGLKHKLSKNPKIGFSKKINKISDNNWLGKIEFTIIAHSRLVGVEIVSRNGISIY